VTGDVSFTDPINYQLNGCVYRIAKTGNAYGVLFVRRLEKQLLGRPRVRWEWKI